MERSQLFPLDVVFIQKLDVPQRRLAVMRQYSRRGADAHRSGRGFNYVGYVDRSQPRMHTNLFQASCR